MIDLPTAPLPPEEPIPDDEHLAWLCPKCRTVLEIMGYRSWIDGSPGYLLECPECHWYEKPLKE